jgi:hypothetical protein
MIKTRLKAAFFRLKTRKFVQKSLFLLTLTSPIGLFFPLPTLAQTAPSLFFNGGELTRIEAEIAGKERPAPETAQDTVTLGAIVYYGPKNWAVWLQGERWTPATKHPELQILDVKPGLVRATYSPPNGAKKSTISLKPYQTFHAATGKITEGNQ